jgi:hypothetical protein
VSRLPHVAWRTAAVVAVVALAACSTGTDRPSDCDASSVSRDVTLRGNGKLDLQSINVCRGQEVTIDVTVEADGVLHLHGYDDQAPATSVTAGTETAVEFTATHVGQFVIQLHTHDAEIGAGVLTVHDR